MDLKSPKLTKSQEHLALVQIKSRHRRSEKEHVKPNADKSTVMFQSKPVCMKGEDKKKPLYVKFLSTDEEEMTSRLACKEASPSTHFSKKQAEFRRKQLQMPNPWLHRSMSPKYAPSIREVKELTVECSNRFRFIPPPLIIEKIEGPHKVVDNLAERELTPRAAFRKIQAKVKQDVEEKLKNEKSYPILSRLF